MTIDYLFNQIAEEFAHNSIPGWCPIEKANDLAATVVALRPKITVEIGVFGGLSLIPMAMACEAIDCGVVIGIDPWSAQASTEGYTEENANWWGGLDHQKIYDGFIANLRRLGLENRVAIERAKSDDAALPNQIDIFHCDGQHTEQAIRDVEKYASRVRLGGICVCDDLSWRNNGQAHVAQAVDALLELGFIELYRRKQENGEWGVFQRIATPKRLVVLKPVEWRPKMTVAQRKVVKKKWRK